MASRLTPERAAGGHGDLCYRDRLVIRTKAKHPMLTLAAVPLPAEDSGAKLVKFRILVNQLSLSVAAPRFQRIFLQIRRGEI